MMLLLAATKAVKPALFWLGGLIVIVIIAGLIILKLRSMMLARDPGAGADEGLMDGLRKMRDRGELSQEEFDAAKQNMVKKLSGKVGPAPPPAPALGMKRAKPGYDLTGERLPDQPGPNAG